MHGYVNKSLWKEDEVFIKNVKKIYEKNANEVQMYSQFGTIAWDYANCINNFNETYLIAPILKNNEVVASVITRRIGNKVFYKFTRNDLNTNEFFRPIIFDDRKSIYGSDNTKSDNAARDILKCRTVTFEVGVTPGTEPQDVIISTKTICEVIKDITTDNTCITCSASGGGGDDGGGGYSYPDPEKDPCSQSKEILSNPNVKPKITDLENFAKSSKDDEKGFKENKDGTITDADENGKHRVTFKDVSTMNGGYHNHTLNGLHMFSSHDISTMIEIARYQNVGNTGNVYFGMVSSENHYIITFNGNNSDLPANNFSQYDLDYWDTFQVYESDKLKLDSNFSTNKILNEAGLEKIFFDTLKNMGLDGKVNLMKVNEDGSTSKITQNPDGTTTPVACS